MNRTLTTILAALAFAPAATAQQAQTSGKFLPGEQGSRNVHVISHVPLGRLFTYKHSDGRVLLFPTSTGPFATIWDMGKFVAGSQDQGFIAKVPIPDIAAPTSSGPTQGRSGTANTTGTYHDFYVAYDPATHQ